VGLVRPPAAAVPFGSASRGEAIPFWPSTVRHLFATHFLEGGIDIRTIQDLLGYKDLKTRMIYTHVVNRVAVRSPLDRVHLGIKYTQLVVS